RHQDGGARRLRAVQRELGARRSVRGVTPVREQPLAETRARRPLQEPRGDDLVRVDVVHGQDDGAAGEDAEGLHGYLISSRASVTRPVTAAAAAVSGLARRVRPPGPCRPSKLRLLVLTAYCPGESRSPFIAMHIEQPASRHSAPASVNTRSSPSASAAFLMACEPGTTSTRTPSAT